MDVEPVAVKGVWWRHIPASADPLHRPPDPADGRWQTGTIAEALYLGQTPETIWAEWYRFLAEAGIPPDISLPRDLWRWQIALVDIADLSDSDRLDRVGLSPPVPRRANWAPYQAVGNALFKLGWRGLLAPSAARPGDLVLCVFRARLQTHGATPSPPPQRVNRPPVVPTGLRT